MLFVVAWVDPAKVCLLEDLLVSRALICSVASATSSLYVGPSAYAVLATVGYISGVAYTKRWLSCCTFCGIPGIVALSVGNIPGWYLLIPWDPGQQWSNPIGLFVHLSFCLHLIVPFQGSYAFSHIPWDANLVWGDLSPPGREIAADWWPFLDDHAVVDAVLDYWRVPQKLPDIPD